MQFAITGKYKKGQIYLQELPPIDEPSDVMVVFLPNKKLTNAMNFFDINQNIKTQVAEEKAQSQPLKIKTMADLGGVLAPYVEDYVSDKDMEEAITQGIQERAMLK